MNIDPTTVKRILYLSSWYPYPPDNGSRLRAYHLAHGLAAKHRVTLLALRDAEQTTDAADSPCERVLTVPRRVFKPTRLRALAGFFSSQPRSVADTYDSNIRTLIGQTLEANSFDVVIAGELSMAVYAAEFAHPAKIFDDIEVAIFTDAARAANALTRWRSKLTLFKFARYLRGLARHFDALTVVSEQERAQLAAFEIPAAKISIVPNGVDCAAFAPSNLPIEPFTMIYNGALTYAANLDAMRYFVRDILPLVRAREPRAKLKITGRAPEFAINELSQDNVVSFTGYVQDVRAVMQTSAVCVVPLRVGGGTRLKILEAMALGTPVVATSKGAEGLNVQAGQHVCLADTPQTFADAIITLWNDAPLRARLVRAARERVCDEYDWRAIQARLEEIVTRVTTRKSVV